MENLLQPKNLDRLQIFLQRGMIEIKWKQISLQIKFLQRRKLLKFLPKEDTKLYWTTMKMERIQKRKFRNTKNNNKITIMYLILKIILRGSKKKSKTSIINPEAITQMHKTMNTMTKKRKKMKKNLLNQKIALMKRRNRTNKNNYKI